MRKILFIFSFLLASTTFAQELNCKVVVNAEQIQTTERRIFDEMENAFNQFINNRKWTEDNFKVEERINCNIILTLDPNETQPANGRFKASVQILASRPVYGTNYQTVIFNFADRDWVFEYQQSQPMQFNVNNFTTNITSLLAYYAYTIIGLDYDTFSDLGGTRYFQIAQQIVTNAQNSGYRGWTQFNSIRNRYWLNENLINTAFEPLRKGLYLYHIKGMDLLTEKPDEATTNILEALRDVQKVNRTRPRSILTISFLDAKADELVQIFKNAPNDSEKKIAYDILRSVDPARVDSFNKILE